MRTAIAIPYVLCFRCRRQRRGFNCRCDDPGRRDVLGVGMGLFKHNELVMGGSLLALADALDSTELRSLGTYIAGKSMYERFGITLDDIRAHFELKVGP